MYRTAHTILNHIAVVETRDGISQIINGAIEVLTSNLDVKVAELLEPHYTTHAITYDYSLVQRVQKVQSERRRRKREEMLKQFLKCTIGDFDEPSRLQGLLEELEKSEPDMERHASSQAVDYMEAYYVVS